MPLTDSTPLVSDATECANDMLLASLREITGISVTSHATPPLGYPVLTVVVPPGDDVAEEKVYRAEQDAHQRYPTARIELYVV